MQIETFKHGKMINIRGGTVTILGDGAVTDQDTVNRLSETNISNRSISIVQINHLSFDLSGSKKFN